MVQIVYLLISQFRPPSAVVAMVARWNASLTKDGEYFSRYVRKFLVSCSISGIFTT